MPSNSGSREPTSSPPEKTFHSDDDWRHILREAERHEKLTEETMPERKPYPRLSRMVRDRMDASIARYTSLCGAGPPFQKGNSCAKGSGKPKFDEPKGEPSKPAAPKKPDEHAGVYIKIEHERRKGVLVRKLKAGEKVDRQIKELIADVQADLKQRYEALSVGKKQGTVGQNYKHLIEEWKKGPSPEWNPPNHMIRYARGPLPQLRIIRQRSGVTIKRVR